MSKLFRLLGTAAAAGTLVLVAAIPASAQLQYGLVDGEGWGATPSAAITAARAEAVQGAAEAGFEPNTCSTKGSPTVTPFDSGYDAVVMVECRIPPTGP